MADQNRRGDSAGGSLGGSDRQNGYGDDQGTRVGRPDSPSRQEDTEHAARGKEGTGPSSQPVKEGIEGAILEGDEDDTAGRRGSTASGGRRAHGSGRSETGAGGEAAEGVHAVGGRDEEQRSSMENVDHSNSDVSPGSEPVRGRTYEHKGGYGGEGGEPRR